MMRKDERGIVDIMTKLYEEIRELEMAFGLQVGQGDVRPRVEFFHDAIRAFTSGKNPERLTVERLAYDVSALRYVQAMPLESIRTHGRATSVSTEMITHNAQAVGHTKPDKESKQRLADLYIQYAILFAALLKPNADEDYRDRIEEMQQTLSDLKAALGGMGQGDPGEIKEKIGKMQQGIAGVDSAHLSYVTGQLALYEEGKSTVKKLAAHGMNLAGQFVDNAMAAARRDMGRGR